MNRWSIATAATMALSVLLPSCHEAPAADGSIYSCESFTLYPDSVVEGSATARAVGFGSVESDYAYADSSRCAPQVRLRFCLNGRDSEMARSVWHTAYIVPGDTTPAMTFGATDADSLRRSRSAIPNSMRNRWTIRLDMRPVLRSIDRRGFFVTAGGDTIFREHFKGVWVTGPDAPLTADVRTLHDRNDMRLLDHGDSTYLLTLNMREFAPVSFTGGYVSIDSIPRSVPGWASRQPLFDVAYAISSGQLCEMLGRRNQQIGTMEAAHAVCLSLALIDPQASMELLRSCVRNGRIVQDAGAGGAWPITSERLLWIVAAYEVYKATGDRRWLREAEAVASRTIADDEFVLYDPSRRLLHGAVASTASGLRSYPSWMSPRDYYASFSLRVNAEYAAALRALAMMRNVLGLTPPETDLTDLTDRINFALWTPDLHRYSDFLYCGFFPLQSPATDNLGQSLAVLADVAAPEMAKALIHNTPRWHFGMATNAPVSRTASDATMANVVQPHIQVYWAMAAAKAADCGAVEQTVAAFYRNWAFSLGRGYVNATTGRPLVESELTDGQRLLSAASTPALSLRLFAGVRLDSAGMHLSPYIPLRFSEVHRIEHLRYREAVLDIEIRGRGSIIHSMTIDGKETPDATVPADLTGYHIVRIFMVGNRMESGQPVFTRPEQLPPIPDIRWSGDHLASVIDYEPSQTCLVIVNGAVEDELRRADCNLADLRGFSAVSFANLNQSRHAGFVTRPRLLIPRGAATTIPASVLGEAGTGLPVGEERESRYLELSPARNLTVDINLRSPSEASYFLDVRYANGSGQEDAQSRCVIRTVTVNGRRAGTLVMPCMGEGDWFTEAYSNAVPIRLAKGVNRVTISFVRPFDLNAAGNPGTVLINHVRLIRRL